MQIANPIYDVVFKYLMEDNESAVILISTIIGKEVLSLEYRPTEKTVHTDRDSLTVYRLDFSAEIQTPDGPRKVLIEIQKAKFPTDIPRFRKYLGKQYQSKDNIYMIDRPGTEIKAGIPIIAIYFLGYTMEHTSAPAIKVCREYTDLTNGKSIAHKEYFIESVSHDVYIIQIPHLRESHQSEIEELLDIFNQTYITVDDDHILNIHDEKVPGKFKPLVRRLTKAMAEEEIRDCMDMEDDILEELEGMARLIVRKDEALEKNKKALEENKKALEEKDRVLEENRKTMEEKDRVLEENKKALEENRNALKEQQKLIEALMARLDERE